MEFRSRRSKSPVLAAFGEWGDESALSTAKAEAMLGWTPDHSWRDAEDEDVPEPSLYEA